jgi:uncharacterized protein
MMDASAERLFFCVSQFSPGVDMAKIALLFRSLLRGITIILLPFLLGITASHAQATFSCAEARNCTESVICATPQLGELDRRMSRLYFQLRDDSTRREARRLLESQRDWLENRNSCGCNANCLVEMYKDRIAKFEHEFE